VAELQVALSVESLVEVEAADLVARELQE